MNDDPLNSLPRELPPPAALRGRIVAALRARSLVGAGTPRRPWLRIAAALTLFAAGAATGRFAPSALTSDSESPMPRFALLLYEPAAFDTTASHDELAAEYGAWAASLGAQFVSGDALGDSRTLGGESPAVEPTGFFIVNAVDYDAALTLARECPHLRHGGVVTVRTVPTS
jgi:hypothetical protein